MADYVLFVVCCLLLIYCALRTVFYKRCHCINVPNHGIPIGIEAR
jgi:hypothetical protein